MRTKLLVPGMALAALMAVHAGPATAQAVLTPAGAENLCSTLAFACRADSAGSVTDRGAILALAKNVNSQVNRSVRPRTDQSLYGVAEKWTLPGKAGDCEDYALLKMQKLIGQGIAPRRLRLAQVAKRGVPSHVVLTVEVAPGEEYVLDNLASSVAPRRSSAYVFLKQQKRDQPSRWEAAL